MTTAFITWCGVLTLVCLILVTRVIVDLIEHHNRTHRVHHIVEMSNEREMFFVPGDSMRKDDDLD